MERFAGILSDFLIPPNLDKSILKNGLIENVKLKFTIGSLVTKEDFSCSSNQFHQFLNKQYPYLRTSLKYHFESFIALTNPLKPPKVENNHILTEEMLYMLMLVNNKFHSQSKLDLLYSSKMHGQSFNKLAYNIVGWPSPAMILLKTSYKTLDNDFNENIIGAMTFCQFQDRFGYYGDHSTFLFSLSPFFKTIMTRSGKRESNYVYLNTNASSKQ